MLRSIPILCAFVAFSACCSADTTDRPLAEQSPKYKGYTNEAFLSFVENLPKDVKSIKVASLGGNSLLTMDAVELINQAGIAVVIEEFCFSSCAHYIFMAVDDVSVSENTILAFHHSNLSAGLRFARSGLMSQEEYDRVVQPTIDRERDFYIDHKIDWRFLVQPDLERQPLCVGDVVTWLPNGMPHIHTEDEFDYWLPSYKILSQMNPEAKFEFDPAMIPFPQVKHIDSYKFLSQTKFLFDTYIKFEVDRFDEISQLPYCGTTPK